MSYDPRLETAEDVDTTLTAPATDSRTLAERIADAAQRSAFAVIEAERKRRIVAEWNAERDAAAAAHPIVNTTAEPHPALPPHDEVIIEVPPGQARASVLRGLAPITPSGRPVVRHHDPLYGLCDWG